MDQKTFDSNWDQIFKKKSQEVKIECGECGWIGTKDDMLPDEDYSGLECPSCGTKI